MPRSATKMFGATRAAGLDQLNPFVAVVFFFAVVIDQAGPIVWASFFCVNICKVLAKLQLSSASSL